MDGLRRIADARIRDAIERGDFEDLPGRGKPLELEDLSRVPEDLRGSYIVCKNAGMLPEEMELRKELVSLHALLQACAEAEDARELKSRIGATHLRLQVLADRRRESAGMRDYRAKITQRLTRWGR